MTSGLIVIRSKATETGYWRWLSLAASLRFELDGSSWYTEVVTRLGGDYPASIAKRPESQWRARYRDHAGKEHSRHSSRKIDAQNLARLQLPQPCRPGHTSIPHSRITVGAMASNG
jgi:hypothetical protein